MHTGFSRRSAFLIAALQFVYMLDFVMLLPLAPDLAQALGFAATRVGWLTSAYTLAALLAGLISLRYLDRFARKPALLWCFGALTLATFASSFASDLNSLLLLRALTGLCGAPALALGIALIIDTTTPEQRGRALGMVMAGFSVAVVAGVPLALTAAHWGGWRAPFFFLAGCAVLVWLALYRWLPDGTASNAAQNAGQNKGHTKPSLRSLLAKGKVRHAMLLQALSQFSAFLLIPHFSAYFLLNLNLPHQYLSWLYFTGGIAAFATVQLFGRLTDRLGPTPPALIASLGFGCGLLALLGILPGLEAAMLCFILFMAGNAGRNISLATHCSQIPAANERAAFMALQNMVQDLAISAAALLASVLLMQDGNGKLLNMPELVAIAAVAAIALLVAMPRRQSSLVAT